MTEALERPGSVSVGRKSAETVRSRRRFADRCRPDLPPPRSEPASTCCGPEDEDEDEDEDEEETASLSANEAVSRWHTSDQRRVLKKSTVAGFTRDSPQEPRRRCLSIRF